jgi:hypothetical protein
MKKVNTEKLDTAKPNTLNITGDIVAIKWDETAVQSIIIIADALRSNAQALGKLADVIRVSGCKIESLIKSTADGMIVSGCHINGNNIEE